MAPDQHEPGKRPATVLVAGFTGFNDLSDHLGPEAITALINRLYSLSDSLITLYGGTLDKFSGEGFLALFGISGDAARAPYNAIHAAIDLHYRIDELTGEMDLAAPVRLRTGIQTGHVLVGKVGAGENVRDALMGEAVVLASRICDIADPGQVLTGQETFERTKDKFEFQILEPVPMKGMKKPLPVFEVKGKRSTPRPSDKIAGRMIGSAMVGREREFRLLEKQVMQLINGRGSVVTIEGQAGIGKSRLVSELKETEVMRRVALFEGRAFSTGKNLSFHPIIQIIKSWAGIREEDVQGDALIKLQRAIHRVHPGAIDEIYPFIATMMGYRLEGKARERTAGIEGEALENLILKNLRDLLSKAATVLPIVIVIEDAHWCDTSSVIFLESLFKLTLKQRILFVNIFRPDYPETGERLKKYLVGNLKSHSMEIGINPLTQVQSEVLIQNLLHQADLPEEINSLIVERAAGNPFFMEEVIRSFLDEGLIEIIEDRLILTGNIRYANIPESIDKVILTRIERLDEHTKELLKTASVIGRNFYYKILEDAARNIEEMDNRLEYLKDVQLLKEQKQKDEVEFLFKHALAQQATYESIMEKTKKELHLKIASSIEKVFADRIHEFYGILAHHYTKAGQSLKAEEYLVKAGEESMRSGAASEAVNYLKRALEINLQNNENTPDRKKVVDLQERLGYACFFSGQFVETIEYFEKVIAFYSRPMPKSGIRALSEVALGVLILRIVIFLNIKAKGKTGPVSEKMWDIIDVNGHALTAIDPKRLFIEVFCGYRRLLRINNWSKREAAIMLSTSQMLFYTGIFIRLGRSLMDYALKNIDEKYVSGWMNGLLARSMQVYFFPEKFTEFEEEELFGKAFQIGEYWKPSTFYVYNGYSAIESGNEKIVLHYLKRLKALSEAFDNKFPEIQYHRLKTALFVKFRKMEEVIEVTDEAIVFAKKTDYKMQHLLFNCLRSISFSIMDEPEKARNSLSEAELLLKDFRIRFCNVHYLLAKCYIDLAQIKKEPINGRTRKSVMNTIEQLVSQSRKVHKVLPEAFRLKAIVFWELGRPGKAMRNFKKSIEIAIGFDGRIELSRTYFESGKFLRDPKNKMERINGMNSTECLMKAKAMFDEMNLEWDLKEYKKYFD
jgi:class 3 adenylate cyclase/tetratricopeptide (TPR) repeat protein